jgi:hypothetical protein
VREELKVRGKKQWGGKREGDGGARREEEE